MVDIDLLAEQLALCEEWRTAHFGPPLSTLEPWEKEVNEFSGAEELSDEAWIHLQEWYRTNHS